MSEKEKGKKEKVKKKRKENNLEDLPLDVNHVHHWASHQLSLHRGLGHDWRWWSKREGVLFLLLFSELPGQVVRRAESASTER